MDIGVKLGDLTLAHPIMNAAGMVKRTEHVQDLVNSETAAVVVGGITLARRDGNVGNNFWYDAFQGCNSLGLPNPGKEYYVEELPTMVTMCHDVGKPIIVNVNGFTPEEFAELVEFVYECGVDLAEINLGCPNLWDEGTQKRIFSFYPDLIGEILKRVKRRIGRPVSLKLSPFSNPANLRETAEVASASGVVAALASVNTFANALFLAPDGKPRITMRYGGLSGPAMKGIGLGNVSQLHEMIPTTTIIGVGGIETGQDVLDYRRAGADVVQVGTALFRSMNPRVLFSRILGEYIELIAS